MREGRIAQKICTRLANPVRSLSRDFCTCIVVFVCICSDPSAILSAYYIKQGAKAMATQAACYLVLTQAQNNNIA